MIHNLYLIEVTMTDGSIAYDVKVGDGGPVFPCVTLDDAEGFMILVEQAIGRHTNEKYRRRLLFRTHA